MARNGPVLVISHLYEPGVNRVVELLDRMDVPWRRLNCEDVPLLTQISLAIDAAGERISVQGDDVGALAYDDLRSIWHRRLAPPALPARWGAKDRRFAANEVAALLEGTLFQSSEVFAVNDRSAERSASNKLRQLRVAREAGLAVPATIVTNVRAELEAFRERVDGPLIFKPISGFAPRGNDFSRHLPERFERWGPVVVTDDPAEDDVEIVFAQLLDETKSGALDMLELCPVAFQRFIPKTADIRVTIVGDTIFPCRIHSQELDATKVDFRRMSLLPNMRDLRHELCDLPVPVGEALRTIMGCLGLVFGCVDLVEEADGTLTFLEVNPSGQWLWVEHFTGAPISEHIAVLLAEGHA